MAEERTGKAVTVPYQPNSLSRLLSMPKWYAISWTTVRRA